MEGNIRERLYFKRLLHGVDVSNPANAKDVMAQVKQHLCIENQDGFELTVLL